MKGMNPGMIFKILNNWGTETDQPEWTLSKNGYSHASVYQLNISNV